MDSLSPNQLILNQEATARPYSDILTIQCMISSFATSKNAHKIQTFNTHFGTSNNKYGYFWRPFENIKRIAIGLIFS